MKNVFPFVALLALPSLVSPQKLPIVQKQPVLLVPSIPSAPLPASYGGWHSCKIGGGGYVQNVVFAPSDPKRLYAYVDVGGVYRSDDGGERWRMMNRTLRIHAVRSLDVDPRNADRLIAAVGDQWDNGAEGICISKDGGETWKLVQKAFFYGNSDYRSAGVVLARDPKNPDMVLAAGAKDGVLRSVDGGTTWQKTTGADGLYPTDIKFSRDGKRVLLCAHPSKPYHEGQLTGGYFASNDGGQTWQKMSDEAPTETVQAAKDTARWYGIFEQAPILRVSTDNGTSWQDFTQGLPPPGDADNYTSDTRFDGLAVGPDFVTIGSRKGTFYKRPTNGGEWSKIERMGVTEIYEGKTWYGAMQTGKWQHFGSALGSIVIDPKNPNRWFFTDWYAIYQTTDAGKHWNLSMNGVEVTVLHTLTQDPSDPRHVHLGMADNGYLYSDDGGERFVDAYINSNMKGIAVSPADPTKVYGVGDPANGQWRSNTVYLSADKGKTWAKSPMIGLPDPEKFNRNSIAVDPKDANHVYVAVAETVKPGEGGVYQSTDGGKNWHWLGQGLEGDGFFRSDIWNIGREVAVDSAGNLLAISQDKWQVKRFDPKVGKWEDSKVDSPGKVQPRCLFADPKTAGRFFIAAFGDGGGIFRTDDAGKSWKRAYNIAAAHIAIDMANPQRIVAGLSEGVVLSRDGGATWQKLDERLPARTECRVAFAGNRVLVGTGGSGAFWIDIGH